MEKERPRCRYNPVETFVNEKAGREFSWGSCPLCRTVVTVSATVNGVLRNLRRHNRTKHLKERLRLITKKGPCPCRVCRQQRKESR